MGERRTVAVETTLLAFLFSSWPEAKKGTVRDWLKRRHVTVNGRAVTAFDHRLRGGDEVKIQSASFAAPRTELPGGLVIRHEDDAVIAIEKPAGLLSIASASERDDTAYARLTEHVRRGHPRGRERVWIVHRLDRETSGLMVFAKTEGAKVALQESWEKAEKVYLAVVEGVLPEDRGMFTSHLDESDPLRVRAVTEGPGTRRAVTHYRVMRRGEGTTLVELRLETGRRHQIRVQLKEAGCPIVGDKLYGAKTNPIRRVALHASSLSFLHPGTGKAMKLISALPGEFGRIGEKRKAAE